MIVSGLALRQASIRLGERSERALYDLRTRLIGHIHQLSLATHNDERRGGLVSRVTSDIESLAQFFQWGGLAWLLDGTLMVIVAAVMLAYNWQLALIAFAVSMPLAFVLRAVQSRLVRAYDGARHANGDMLGTIAEVVSGTPTIRAYGAGEVLEAARARRRRGQDARPRSRRRSSVPSSSRPGEIFSAFTISAIVGRGRVDGSVGAASRPVRSSASSSSRIGSSNRSPSSPRCSIRPRTPWPACAGCCRCSTSRSVRRRRTIRSRCPPARCGSTSATSRSRIRAATGQGDDSAVLKHIDVTIPAGQQVAIVGSTGSGKTTLGRLIARFADPTIGAIELGGVPLRRVDRAELRRRLIVVSQEPFLFDDSISANVAVRRRSTRRRATSSAWSTNSASRDWVESLSDGLATKVGERGDQLSAGERQLVALLRAGLAGPDVLILDEATSSVDALTEVRVARALERLAASRTTIAIAHRLSTAARADRVLVLEHGRLVEDGHHDELIAIERSVPPSLRRLGLVDVGLSRRHPPCVGS